MLNKLSVSRIGLRAATTLGLAALFVFVLASPARAQVVPLPAGFELETVASGLVLPTTVAFVPDGRIFIGEKAGAVRVIKNGVLLGTPLIRLTDVNTFGDKGLIGMAVDPNFSSNGFLYLLYTHENTPGTNIAGPKTGRLVRVTVVGDIASESSEVILLGSVGGSLAAPSCEDYAVTADCIPSDTSSHSVGGLRFGLPPDNHLYVSLGDGAHFDYVDSRALRAQNLDSLGGKILRINTQGFVDANNIMHDTAPTDNPFYNGDPNANRSKVWALGVRNAYRFNFRPSNSTMYTSDVGWSTWEEVNTIKPGDITLGNAKNFGWPCREGFLPATSNIPLIGTVGYNCTPSSPYTDPIYTYHHNAVGAGAITGGAFATAYPPEYANAFFFGDYAQNWIKIMRVNSDDTCVLDIHGDCTIEDFYQVDFSHPGGPVEMVTGPDGYLYYLAIYTGKLNRISYTLGNRQPSAVPEAISPTFGSLPLTVDFSGSSSSDPDAGDVLSYSWNFGDGSPVSTDQNPSHQYTVNGTYAAALTVTDGNGGIDTKSITITAGKQAPTATIISPTNGSLYLVNQTIHLSGAGVDPEDGALSCNITNCDNITWEVILHHNTHTHTLYTIANGNPLHGLNPSFPAGDDPVANVTDIYTEVRLIVTDSDGLTDTKSINLYLNNSGANVVGNLILNPSVETLGTAGQPEHWGQGGYDTNNRIFSYEPAVPGFEGGRAIKLQVTDYVAGDAKWFPDPMYVVPGATYTFSDNYLLDTPNNEPSYITVQFSCNNGTYAYQQIAAPTPTTTWQSAGGSFEVTPKLECFGQYPVAVTIFHQLRSNGTLTTDNFALHIQDTEPPTVTVTNPIDGQIVSGTIDLSADADDNLGISHVHFLVDGNNVDEDSTHPYSVAFDTTTLSNGPHIITAEAHDLIGLETTSAPVTVTVQNVVDPNIIPNHSVENDGGNGSPEHWSQGWFGSVTPTFTYPVEGTDGVGSKAIKVELPAASDGDAKWFFEDVAVTPGQYFIFSDKYNSTAPSTVKIRYTKANPPIPSDPYIYEQIGALPSSSGSWATFEKGFLVPDGMVSLTMFHFIQEQGALTTDDYSLVEAENPDKFSQGLVSLTFDDGWSSIYSNAIPILDVANLKSTQYVITGDLTAQQANLITNSSLEITDENDELLRWFHTGFGDNTAVYSIAEGAEGPGTNAVKVELSNYVNGDAKWYFDDVPVTPEQDYVYLEKYLAPSTPSTIQIRYIKTDGSFEYPLSVDLPASDTWQTYKTTITIPEDVASITVFHLIQTNGSLTTDDFSLTNDSEGRIALDQALAMWANGHDIEAHTRTHPSLIVLPASSIASQVGGSRRDLKSLGFEPVDSLAYPYGDYNATVQQALRAAGYSGGRSVDRGFNSKSTDRYALKIQQVDATTTLGQVQAWVDSAAANKTWLILMFHQVDHSGSTYSTTPEELQQIVDYLVSPVVAANTSVVTVSQGLQQMNPGPVLPTDTTAPTIALNGSSTVNVQIGDTYTELGATATDDVDGDSTAYLAITGSVDTATHGTYLINYNVDDLAGNHATQVTRTVNVGDFGIPLITLLGDNPQVIEVGSAYVELGATVIDNQDVGLVATIDASAVNTNVPGSYQVSYNAVDTSGNHATEKLRAVNVTATPAPVITGETPSAASQTSITVTWTTDHPATARVIFDTVSHSTLSSGPNYGYANSTIEDTTLETSHSVIVTGLTVGTTYFLRVVSHGSPEAVGNEITKATNGASSGGGGGGGGGGFIPPVVIAPVVSVTPPTPQVLGAQTASVTAEEQDLLGAIDMSLTRRLAGRILLQTERLGQAWYLDPLSLKKYYLANGDVAYSALRKFGLGIKNVDLAKIPVGHESRFTMADTDSDGLPDKLEEALGTDLNKADTDGDGVKDGIEVLTNRTNPLGTGKFTFSSSLASKLKGRILLQVESRGEAWYVSPVDGKRYYLANGEAAYQIMRYLSLGITNLDIRKIPVGEPLP